MECQQYKLNLPYPEASLLKQNGLDSIIAIFFLSDLSALSSQG